MKKFSNYERHLEILKTAGEQDLSNEFIISGIIDKFSIQFELGWKVLKEILLYEGIEIGKTGSPREILKGAYKYLDVIEEESWLSMLRERNDMTHMYNGEAAKALAGKIIREYIPVFLQLQKKIRLEYGDALAEIER